MFGPNGTIHSSGGISVIDGRGLLFYIGLKGWSPFNNYSANNSPARNFVFNTSESIIGISVIGGGGGTGGRALRYCGGSGGGGASAIIKTKGNINIRIGGGMNTHWTASAYGWNEGSSETHPGTTLVTDEKQTFKLVAYSGGSKIGGGSYVINNRGFVHTSTGCNGYDNGGCQTTYGTQQTNYELYNTLLEPNYGGRGQGLNGYSGLPSTKGSGLGGGGGGQNSVRFGGSNSPSGGGQFGYQGGYSNPDKNGNPHSNHIYNYGYGPSPGESINVRGNYSGRFNNGGGGGSFGGGGGNDGYPDDSFGAGGTGAGGAVILMVYKNLFTMTHNKGQTLVGIKWYFLVSWLDSQ